MLKFLSLFLHFSLRLCQAVSGLCILLLFFSLPFVPVVEYLILARDHILGLCRPLSEVCSRSGEMLWGDSSWHHLLSLSCVQDSWSLILAIQGYVLGWLWCHQIARLGGGGVPVGTWARSTGPYQGLEFYCCTISCTIGSLRMGWVFPILGYLCASSHFFQFLTI